MGKRMPQHYECLGTTRISQMGIKKLFYIFKPIMYNSQKDHMYNSQKGIQIWFPIWKLRILLFKNHLHSGLTRIDRKTLRIWLKWEKKCLNVTRAREPTYISQIGIKKLIYIFKPIIPLLPNSLHSERVKLGTKMTRSWEKRGPKTTRLCSQLGRRVQLSKLV
jgi:hypothetical protein